MRTGKLSEEKLNCAASRNNKTDAPGLHFYRVTHQNAKKPSVDLDLGCSAGKKLATDVAQQMQEMSMGGFNRPDESPCTYNKHMDGAMECHLLAF